MPRVCALQVHRRLSIVCGDRGVRGADWPGTDGRGFAKEARVYQHRGMHFATAVQRLHTIADGCQRISRLWTDCPVVVGVYAFGAVLEYPADIPVVEVVFVVGQPAEELAWGAQPPYCHSLIHLLNLHKAPVDWYWRPSAWRPISEEVGGSHGW